MHKLNFHLDLLEKDNISTYYTELLNVETNKLVHTSSLTGSSVLKNNLVYIDDVPNYLNAKINTQSETIKLKKINTYQGSLINLGKYNNFSDYLLSEISTKERSEIRRRQKRLDHCIKPTYKMFYGAISEADYNMVFNDYKQMLVRRLEQKQSYWEELDYWEARHKSTFQLIHQKKACVFVIYHNKKPIAIYINSIFGTAMFNEVVAYDIDFSRFNIGILIFLKTIEWAINNKFELIDMSKGDFSYKERFRNGTYTFQNHIIYNNKELLMWVKANLLILKISLIYKLLPWLKKMKINTLYTNYKRIKKRHIFKDYVLEPNRDFHIEKIAKMDPLDDLKLINIENPAYGFLKKPSIDFAFLNVEHFDDIVVYNKESNENTYFFKGKNAIQKIVFK